MFVKDNNPRDLASAQMDCPFFALEVFVIKSYPAVPVLVLWVLF